MHHIGGGVGGVHGPQVGGGHAVFGCNGGQGIAGLHGVGLFHHRFSGQLGFQLIGRYHRLGGVQPLHRLHLLHEFCPLGAVILVVVGILNGFQYAVQLVGGLGGTDKAAVHIQAGGLRDGVACRAQDGVTQLGVREGAAPPLHGDRKAGHALYRERIVHIHHPVDRQGGSLGVGFGVFDVAKLLAAVIERQAERGVLPRRHGGDQHNGGGHRAGQPPQNQQLLFIVLHSAAAQPAEAGEYGKRVFAQGGCQLPAGGREGCVYPLQLLVLALQRAADGCLPGQLQPVSDRRCRAVETPPDAAAEAGGLQTDAVEEQVQAMGDRHGARAVSGYVRVFLSQTSPSFCAGCYPMGGYGKALYGTGRRPEIDWFLR